MRGKANKIKCNCGLFLRTDLRNKQCVCGRQYEYSDNPVGKIVKQINFLGDDKPINNYYHFYDSL